MNNLNVFDAISLSDYKQHEKDYITSILYDNFMGNTKAILYFRKHTKTIVVRLFLEVNLWGSIKTLPILIYLGKDFPVQPPDVYIEQVCEMGKSPQNLYTDVNFKLRTPKLIDWNRNGGLNTVISEINDSFNKFFPIYKLDLNMRHKQYYPPETKLEQNDIIEVKFDAPDKIDIIHPKQEVHHSKSETNLNLHITKKVVFSDSEIKEILVKELVGRVHNKVKKEHCLINQYHGELGALKKDLFKKREFYIYVTQQKDNVINTMNQMTTGLCDQIVKINSYLLSRKESGQNIFSLISVPNEKLVKMIAIEASCEDYLAIIKKAFEKNILSVKDTMRTIRTLTRELFVIKYYRNKLN
jgi:hypothetical protein